MGDARLDVRSPTYLVDPASVQALLSGVPDGKMQIIDLAVDFNQYVWRSEKSWDYLSGFFGKDWIYSTVPNFGGRTALIGDLEFYANGHLEALQSPVKGHLTGFGTSPEGVENNEILYELIAAAGWSNHQIDVQRFLQQYSAARYGSCPASVDTFWKEMRQSSYGTCTNNARFNWQSYPVSRRSPTLAINEHFFKAIEAFLSCSELQQSPLYQADAVQYAAMYLGAKADMLLAAADWADVYGDQEAVKRYASRMQQLLLTADRLLASHPILRLDRWCGLAQSAATSPQEQAQFLRESRRLVTVWGGPSLSDYSARVWSGLVRDYYVPRWTHYFTLKADGKPSDFKTYDRNWCEQPAKPLSEPFVNPLAEARQAIAQAADIDESMIRRPKQAVAFWSPFEFTKTKISHSFMIGYQRFMRTKGLRITVVRGTDSVRVTGVRCSGYGTPRAKSKQPVDVVLSATSAPLEVLLEKVNPNVVLPKEVSVYIELEAPKVGASSYAVVELME